MKNLVKTGFIAVVSACVAISLGACGSDRDQKLEEMDRESQGQAVQTYTSEELENQTGSPYFKDYYTFDEILDLFEVQRGGAIDGQFSKGGYVVDVDSPLKPGTYYFQGSQTTLNSIYIFNPFEASDADSNDQQYIGRASLQYIGSYFLELEQGEVLVFDPEDDSFMMWAAPESGIDVSMPITSGAYRVGIDIPAGVYNITVEEAALEAKNKSVQGEPGAYIMSNMSFPKDESNIIEEVLLEGDAGAQIQVYDGQWLELYAAVATPV